MSLGKFVALLAAIVILLPFGAGAANLTGGINGSVDVGAGGSASSTNTDNSTASDDMASSTDTDATINVGMPDNLRVNALGIAVTAASQVSTNADLEIFSENIRMEDESVAEVDTTDEDRISLGYYHEGRLFGVFPVRVKSTTVVESNTSGTVVVQTRMPWWNMFVTGTGSVSSDVDSSLDTSSLLESDFKLASSAAAKARILELIASSHAQVDSSAAVR